MRKIEKQSVMRSEMNWYKYIIICAFITLAMMGCQQREDSLPLEGPGITDLVNPFIGTGGHGHTFPGAALPFSMVQLSPDTYTRGWDWCSGYHYTDSSVMGFSHTHLSGTGRGDLLDILVMPTVGKVKWEPGSREDPDKGYRSRFSHKEEHAYPGYYEVFLQDYNIRASFTVTPRSGFHRYQFPASDSSHILFDLTHGRPGDKEIEAYLSIKNDSLITGLRRSDGWAKDQHVYFAARFSRPFQHHSLLVDGLLEEKSPEGRGNQVKGVFNFQTKKDDVIYIKVGISPVSEEGALNNLDMENPGWDFEKVKADARRIWERELEKVRVITDNLQRKKVFYTAAYHSYLAPYLYMDIDGKFRGADQKIHLADGFTRYTVFSLWDTFRATHPLFTITQQDRVAEMIGSMMSHFDESGLLPEWSLMGTETFTMIGYHAVPVIADAFFKGIRGFDVEKAYEAMKNSAMQDHFGLDHLKSYNYIPSELENKAVSKTLEYVYDDWCIAQMASALGKEKDYQYFMNRAGAYKNVFDRSTNFMRGKKADGSWVTPFDPRYSSHSGYDFVEANAWQYTWFVPHDVPGLVELMGGEKQFINKLDSLFEINSAIAGEDASMDITGLIGQYAHGNEPSHHVAYLYNYVGQPWKTQEKVRKILTGLYDNTPDGLSGNEDCGQMSSWYILSSMGFYPVNPMGGVYVLGAPVFEKITIQLNDGKTFTIEAGNLSDENKYVRSVTLNNQLLDRTWISHKEIMAGGQLTFEMTSRPNRNWGSHPKSYPPSKPEN
ncbi:GH92 family glycosyl hydrolase [Fulvivirga sp. M361]|uniref:GH92 family glycosyl hydrolase n=1 Tax=Fulvivirga sp. M361 TaxID=2594266 RepID=UPI001C88B808|nr:GH92 family glycosyl hydrolase [Fulvivirga sp. M361]